MEEFKGNTDFLFYSSKDGKTTVQIITDGETVWTTQKGISEIFGVDRTVITKHLQNIFQTNELDENSVSAKIAQTASDGKTYNVSFYNLEAIISVGYRVNSYNATKFRIWANTILKEYLIKGFVLDDERLKQGNKLFGKDYFKELLERIREIRASERMFYEKITDLYATSVDYDKQDPKTHQFFAKVQNKLEYAIIGKTSAEIIKSRVDSTKKNMGLTTWKNSGKEGKIQKTDVTVAKNYLDENEIRALNILVNSYLDYAELQVSRNKVMKMQDWSDKLDAFLRFNEYNVLDNAGKIKKEVADSIAEKEYSKFKVIQDDEFKTDFDKFSSNIITTGKVPISKEPEIKIKSKKRKE